MRDQTHARISAILFLLAAVAVLATACDIGIDPLNQARVLAAVPPLPDLGESCLVLAGDNPSDPNSHFACQAVPLSGKTHHIAPVGVPVVAVTRRLRACLYDISDVSEEMVFGTDYRRQEEEPGT